MSDFRRYLQKKVVLFDGAMGTLLQAHGLKSGRPPEEVLLDDYPLLVSLHRKYAEAGAEVLTTNSFGLNPVKIGEYGFADRFEELNRLAVKAAREAAAGVAPKSRPFIAGDIGPTGMFVAPVGELDFDDAVAAFAKQARIFEDEGVDLFILETFADLREIKAAALAVREVSDKPIVGAMTFDGSGRTTLGVTPEVAAATLDGLQVDVIGCNCGVGAESIAGFIGKMARYTGRPLIAQANAGLPTLKKGKTVFPDTPGSMARWVKRFVESGCRVVGACCGSTPRHIAAMKKELERLGAAARPRPRHDPLNGATALASSTKVVVIGPGQPCVMVGERINPSRKRDFSEKIKKGDVSGIRSEARMQEAHGADVLDVNIGVPGIDEPAMMKRAVIAVNSASALPIAIDSTHPEAIEEALKSCDGKPLINSVNGEKKSLRTLLPLAKKYGAALLGLCIDEKGVPKTHKDRLRIARKIINAAVRQGIPEKEILLDPVTVPVSAEPGQSNEIIEAVRLFHGELGRGSVQGVSNVSFGLPRRPAVNAAHLAMSMEAGLSGAFINPLDETVASIFHASRVLLEQDKSAAKYIHYAASLSAAPSPASGRKGKPRKGGNWKEQLRRAIIAGESSTVKEAVKELLKKGENPLKVSNQGLVPGIREVGRLFEAKELFLPNLLLSAEAMEAGTALIGKALEKSAKKRKPKGTVVLATVEGDIHDIGKNIVATMLRTHGWNVIDLGRSVPAARIQKRAREVKADVVGVSALMTTTVVRMPEVIEAVGMAGIPVMVGGAVLTDSYAGEIGADFYGQDAMAAVRGAEKLAKKRK